MEQYRAYIHSLPIVDSPEVFGLNATADMAFLVKEATNLLTSLCSTQPKVGVLPFRYLLLISRAPCLAFVTRRTLLSLCD